MNSHLQQERIQTLWHFTKNKTKQTTPVCKKAQSQNKRAYGFPTEIAEHIFDMSSNL
jgi:hypothetical protein